MKKSLGEMSYNDLRNELQAFVQEKYGTLSKDGSYWTDYPYVCDVYEKEVVVEKDGKYYIADYSVDDKGNVKVEPFYDAKKTYKQNGNKPVNKLGKKKLNNADAVSVTSG